MKPCNEPRLRVLGALLALPFAASLGGCHRKSEPAPAAPEVSVAQVVQRSVHQWDEFNGRVSAVQTVEIRPRVSGYIEQVAYHEGDLVQQGQLLFSIDPRPYRDALAQAQAELERARSQAALASAQGKRAKALIEAQVISREDFDTRIAADSQGEAAVHAAEAAVRRAQLDLAFTQVRSPIAGRTDRAQLTVGNLVEADTTLLTTVVSADPAYVYFDVDENSFLGYASQGRSGTGKVAGNPVRLALADESGFPHVGSVDFLSNRVDPATGTIHARAVVANPQGLFTPGLFVRVQLQAGGQFNALLIDDKAVLTDQDRNYVYVLAPDGTAMRKDVVLGRTADGLRIVKSGLAPNDKVIVNGLAKIFAPGMPVTARTVPPPGTGTGTAGLR
ncbi:MAG TPA: efflux RND transporter periplasmic adaptor subunit [Stenotrophomonas sp.]|nr:efflux RND transporter periplasmic adaptor subunit [Stenotrophomonas sp.]